MAGPAGRKGQRALSMTPAAVPFLKELIRRTCLRDARDIATRVLAMHSMDDIRSYLTHETKKIWPNFALVDLGT